MPTRASCGWISGSALVQRWNSWRRCGRVSVRPRKVLFCLAFRLVVGSIRTRLGAVREAEELAQHGQSPVAGFRRGGQECLDVAQSTTAQSFLLRWLEIAVP